MVVALHSGFNPHRLLVIDNKTDEPVQRIPLHSSWLGMTWSNHGAKLYVRGNRHRNDVAPIYVFSYANGRLSDKPVHGPAVAFSDLPHREAAQIQLREKGMANHPAAEHHRKPAEHYEHAARHHHEAAKHRTTHVKPPSITLIPTVPQPIRARQHLAGPRSLRAHATIDSARFVINYSLVNPDRL